MKKVLIVDDEKPMARALELKFNLLGFKAKAVNSGEDALTATTEEEYDVILLDLIMPDINGLTVLEKLKEREVKTPVIILSNLSHGDDEKKARQLGATDFLIKANTPISKIVSRVEEIIN